MSDTAETVAAWRQTRTGTFQLPTGLAVTVRRVDLFDLAAQGAIPMPLIGMAKALVGVVEGEAAHAVPLERLQANAEVIDLVVGAALISPRLTETPSDDGVTLDELSFLDRVTIFQWASQGASPFARFRRPAREPGCPAPRGRNVGRAAKRATS